MDTNKLTPELQRAIIDMMKTLDIESERSKGLRAALELGIPADIYNWWMYQGSSLKTNDKFTAFYMAVTCEEFDGAIMCMESVIQRTRDGDEEVVRLAHQEAPSIIEDIDRLIATQNKIKRSGRAGASLIKSHAPAFNRVRKLRDSLIQWTTTPMRG